MVGEVSGRMGLLVVGTLMAGAVSAEDPAKSADVSTYDELIANLSLKVPLINLTTDILANKPILVNYSVTIDGKWYTIKADNSSGGFIKGNSHGSNCDRHLLCTGSGIAVDNAQVNLTNIFFENYGEDGGGWGIRFTN